MKLLTRFPRAFVRKLYTRLEEIIEETIQVKGAYGPTALGIFRKKKNKDQDEKIEIEEIDNESENSEQLELKEVEYQSDWEPHFKRRRLM